MREAVTGLMPMAEEEVVIISNDEEEVTDEIRIFYVLGGSDDCVLTGLTWRELMAIGWITRGMMNYHNL